MKFLSTAVLALALVATLLETSQAKKPSRRPAAASRPSRSSKGSSSRRRAPASRRRTYPEEDEDVEASDDLSEEDEDESFNAGRMYDEDEEEEDFLPSVPAKASRKAAKRRAEAPRKRPVRRDYEDEYDEEDEYERPRSKSSRKPARRGPPPSRRSGGRRPGSVVPYARNAPGSAFTRGLTAIRNSMPDPATVKEAAFSSIDAARKTTSSLSANIYREVKGLTSSELEQVMLKATKPDDTPVKGKHVERLVGVTYQISSRYDIYDAVLRKLWSKMAESDWRTTMKALYILHRFSSDGAPEHAPALKARLRELRRTRDPKRKDKFFNSKQLLAGDARPENIKYRAFLSRYAHYVLLRAQCFGGMFDEIGTMPKADPKKKKAAAAKPITSTCLRVEHLEAATLLLKAGVVCQLKDGEECENTAIAAERVAADMMGLTTAVAKALNRCLQDSKTLEQADGALVQRWCAFYQQELLPQTKKMVKKLSPKLDAYGLFLPSRMGASVAPEVLEKGLSLAGTASKASDSASPDEDDDDDTRDSKVQQQDDNDEDDDSGKESAKTSEPEKALDDDAAYDDEYEYDEEEYYDDEEEE